ncbi:hypothetical protein DFH29DRAFT_1065105 [Suillus ampliporus]|nr:hypothetical protein DFH29DRAFT_1065105 [Suillus ampliporus]
MQHVVPCVVTQLYLSLLGRQDLPLQYTHNNVLSFATSANSFLLARTQFLLFGINQARDPLDFPATSPLPPNYFFFGTGHNSRTFIYKSNENPATQSSADAPTAFKSRVHHLSNLVARSHSHVPLPTVDVPLAWGKPRYAAAGAPTRNEDLIRDEDYVPPPPPNPNSQQQSAAAQIFQYVVTTPLGFIPLYQSHSLIYHPWACLSITVPWVSCTLGGARTKEEPCLYDPSVRPKVYRQSINKNSTGVLLTQQHAVNEVRTQVR